MSTTHHLKTLPAFFDAVDRGEKTFEARVNDRGFQTGDVLVLQRYAPDAGYTVAPEHAHANGLQDHTDKAWMALSIERRVTWMLTGGCYGVEPGWVVMALGPVKPEPVKQKVPGRAAGGHARAGALSPDRRREISAQAAQARWRQS